MTAVRAPGVWQPSYWSAARGCRCFLPPPALDPSTFLALRSPFRRQFRRSDRTRSNVHSTAPSVRVSILGVSVSFRLVASSNSCGDYCNDATVLVKPNRGTPVSCLCYHLLMGISEDKACYCKADKPKGEPIFSPLKKMKVLKKIKRRIGLG